MKYMEIRIKRLEAMVATEARSPIYPKIMVANAGGGVFLCCTLPNPVAEGLAEFYTRTVWNHRDTCPEAGECPNATICGAAGSVVSSARNP
jgi:hypothetical protein